MPPVLYALVASVNSVNVNITRSPKDSRNFKAKVQRYHPHPRSRPFGPRFYRSEGLTHYRISNHNDRLQMLCIRPQICSNLPSSSYKNKTFYIFSPILSAKLPINCFHSPSPQRVLFQLSNLCFSITMFLLRYILYVLSVI